MSTSFSEQLAQDTIGCKLQRPAFCGSRALKPAQMGRVAAEFDAQAEFVRATKRLLDTKHEAYRAVTTVRSQAVAYWTSVTLPYPETGVRLLRRDTVDVFTEKMSSFRDGLKAAANELDYHYWTLKHEAQQRLGQLFDSGDYPDSLADSFDLMWSFPALQAPAWLRQLSPAAFEQESARVRDQFSRAVELAEEMFLAELNELVRHLVERLSGDDDGKPKTFRDSAVENVKDFFDRFKSLSIGSNEELESLVERAEMTLAGVTPATLRGDAITRESVRSRLSGVAGAIDSQLIVAPSRKIRVARPAEVA